MYKRGNEDTSIKGRSGGREDWDWEQGQGRCQGDEFTVLKKNTANWNKSRSEYHWQAILIVLCLLVLYLKHSFFAPYTCVFRAETKSSTGSEKYIKKSKNQETPLFSVSPMKRNISPSLSGPAGKLICQTDPFGRTVLPGLLANCHWASRKALPGFPSTAHVPRGPRGPRICRRCRDRDRAERLRLPSAVCCYLPGTQTMWNVCWMQKPLRSQPQ